MLLLFLGVLVHLTSAPEGYLKPCESLLKRVVWCEGMPSQAGFSSFHSLLMYIGPSKLPSNTEKQYNKEQYSERLKF